MDVLRRVRAYIAEHDLLAGAGPVVVGVSGGPDSLCLLHMLRQLLLEPPHGGSGLTLHVAHLNHDLRGAQSRADANFVTALADRWALPATVQTRDVRALAAARRLSLEEAGRQARYEFLAETALQTGARHIAVAHNADDQAETVLMHFLRGTGVAGLRGMRPKTPLSGYRLPGASPAVAGLHLIRPLLAVPRAAIEAYCAAHGLEPRRDPSNLDTTFFRNRLRHEVLPLLERASPGLRDRLLRTAEVMAADHAVLQQVLAGAWAQVVLAEAPAAVTFDLAALRALPWSVQRALLREAVARLRAGLRDIPFTPIETAVRLAQSGSAGASAPLPGGLALTLGYDSAVLAPAGAPAVPPDIPLLAPGSDLVLAVPGVTPLPGGTWRLRAETGRWPLAEIAANTDPWQAFLAWDEPAPLRLRTRRAGDRFRPQGLGGAAPKLSDFMIAQKVPRAWRGGLPLLERGDEILWVSGWRVSEAAVVRPDTTQALRLRFEAE